MIQSQQAINKSEQNAIKTEEVFQSVRMNNNEKEIVQIGNRIETLYHNIGKIKLRLTNISDIAEENSASAEGLKVAVLKNKASDYV